MQIKHIKQHTPNLLSEKFKDFQNTVTQKYNITGMQKLKIFPKTIS